MPNVLETLPDDAFRPEDRPESQPPSGDPEALSRLAAWSRHEPVMLLVVAEGLEKQLRPALELRDLRVHVATPDRAVERVTRLTPDLVVLDDTLDAVPTLRELSTDPAAASSPVVVLTEKAALAERLRAFRHGAALVLPLAEDVGALALEIERAARGAAGLEAHEVVGAAGEATLDELVQTLESELRTGILSVWPNDDTEATATRLVLGGGRPLTAAIDSFVRTVRENVVSAEPLRYEFEQYAGGEVEDVVDSDLVWDAPTAELSGLRVLLADADAPRADAVAMALRDQGVEVFVADLAPPEGRFRRLRETDPAAILISRHDAERTGYEFIREVRRDVRLRWANLLLVNWDGLWDDASGASVDTLIPALTRFHEKEAELVSAASSAEGLNTRVELLGPARLLRALCQVPTLRRVSVSSRRVHAELDVAGGKVVGAAAKLLDSQEAELEGAAAVAAFLVIATGSVRVGPSEQPLAETVQEAASAALRVAEEQPERLQPSVYAPPISARLRRLAPKKPASAPPSAPPATSVSRTASTTPAPPDSPAPPAAPPPLPPVHVDPDLSEDDVDDLVETLGTSAVVDPGVDAPVKSERADERVLAPSAPPPLPGSHRSPLSDPKPKSVPPPLSARSAGDSPTERPTSETKRVEPQEEAEPASSLAWLWLVAALVVGGIVVFAFRSGPDEPAPEAPTAAPTETVTPATTTPPARPTPEPAPVALKVPQLPQKKLSSCDELLSSVPVPEGVYLGAALAKLKQAREALGRKSLDEARHLFCHALRFDPSNVAASTDLSRMLVDLRDGDQALQWAKKASAAADAPVTAKLTLADAQALVGSYDEAAKTLAGIASPDGGPNASQQQATEALKKDEPRLAERLFVRILLRRPDDGDAARGVATALGAQELPEAEAWRTYADALDRRKR